MRYQIERLLFSFVLLIASVVPRNIFLSVGRLFGLLAYQLDGRHRKVALDNFSSAFPENKTKAVDTVKSCYRHFGSYLFDMLKLLARFDSKKIEEFELVGIENLKSAYDRKKGVIVFTAHYGVWEIMALAHGLRKFSLGVIARPLDNPFLEKLLYRFRTSTGNFVIDKKQAFRPALKALKEGKGIAILIDQNVSTQDRVFVDFFGRRASTTPALALLKLKTDADLIPAFSFPISGNRYRFVYGAPVSVELTGDRAQDVLNITSECTRRIENQIREMPQYWLWMHRRWKTQPDEHAAQVAFPNSHEARV